MERWLWVSCEINEEIDLEKKINLQSPSLLYYDLYFDISSAVSTVYSFWGMGLAVVPFPGLLFLTFFIKVCQKLRIKNQMHNL